MRKKVLIIQNITHEKPGIIVDVLCERNIDFNVMDLSKSVESPIIENYDLITPTVFTPVRFSPVARSDESFPPIEKTPSSREIKQKEKSV